MYQTLDVSANLLASSLVAMEITVGALMKLGDSPGEILEKVCVDSLTSVSEELVCVSRF